MSDSLDMSMSLCVNSFFPTIFLHKSFVVQLHQLSPNVRAYLSNPPDMEGEQTQRNLFGQEKRHDACILVNGPCIDSNVGEDLFVGLSNRNDFLLEDSTGKIGSSFVVGMACAYRD